MKAAVYYETGGPEVFRYEDVPDPRCPPEGVLVEVQDVSIEGGDTLHRAGGEMAGRPHVVGYQCAGVIRIVVDREYPLAEAADAHAHIESRRAFGRVLLVP
jgi:NADPH:quinone reductase-like Zn-dependent oxidoreductase